MSNGLAERVIPALGVTVLLFVLSVALVAASPPLRSFAERTVDAVSPDLPERGHESFNEIDPAFDWQRAPSTVKTVDGYRVEMWDRTTGDNGQPAGLRISMADTVVYAANNHTISQEPSRDINGDGNADLVFDTHTGGMACCGKTLVFATQPEFQPLSVSDSLAFSRTGGDDSTAVQYDSSVRYVFSCGACVNYPALHMRFANGDWQLDVDRMRAAAPEPAAITKQLAAMAPIECGSLAHCETSDRSGFVSLLLTLVYADKVDTAFALIDQHAAPGQAETLRRDFVRGLKEVKTVDFLHDAFGWPDNAIRR